jgi:hypothetical protein
MNKRKQAQLLGILFAEYQILTTEQANIVRSEMMKPTHVFEDTSSLWAFYNYVTGALQTSHPKTWMEDQRVLHYFISSVNNFSTPQPSVQPEPVVEAEVDPLTTNYGQPENQLNILTEIEKTEAEESILEVEELDRNITMEEVVNYTDPAGNTFEAPVVIDIIDLNKDTKMSVMVSPCAAHDLEADKFMDAHDETTEDNFGFDFSDDEDDDAAFF